MNAQHVGLASGNRLRQVGVSSAEGSGEAGGLRRDGGLRQGPGVCRGLGRISERGVSHG